MPDLSKIQEEPADETTRALNSAAHEFCVAVRNFERASSRCPYRVEGECMRISAKTRPWRCGIINCPYCTPIFMMYQEETKIS